jgi:hypothetical protein
MTSRKVFALMASLALLAIASIANAGIVDPTNSYATIAATGIMTIAPGGADSFTIPADHRIDVYLNDSGNAPVEVIASDIWLSDPTAITSWCPGGVVADSSTFAPDPGHTTFTGTPRGGVIARVSGVDYDCSTISVDVVAVGNVIENLTLSFNSPDLNGNGAVTAGDFGIFGLYYNGTSTCADFNESGGNVTAADFGVFAGFYNNSECP